MSDLMEIIEELTDEEKQQLLNFIEELKRKREEPKRGSADAVMRSFGSWKMTPEEHEQFMKDIADCRQLEETDRDLPPRL